MRRPSWSGLLEYGSGAWRRASAASQESSGTLARRASPGTAASTKPSASAIASIVIQTSRVYGSSDQTEESRMDP
jgi:hypothetical protein